ncbi:MAG: lipoprotein-releasing system permease protein [Pyrinomonadaceae bacterium]|jgi:lipoprotein-releasing system permease protein|nr:lipoprotein-releasing system permease protein [Pyrinomonadaceae bacterium]
MPYEIFLAIRYLRSRQRRRLARVTAFIAVLGIAVGVAALIFALALANGFSEEMRDKILRGTSHLTVARNDGQAMREYQEVASLIRRSDGVVSAAGTTYDGAVLIGPRASAYAVLRGIDNTAPQVTADIARTIVAGSVDDITKMRGDNHDLPSVVLGSELATRTGLKAGDSAEIIGAHGGFSSAAGRKRQVLVAGIFSSGLFEYDSTWIYLPLDAAAALSGEDHAAAVVSVQVMNIYDVKQTAAHVQQLLGPSYTTVDWQEANRPLFTALAFERRIGLVIIALIVLIAALNITTTLVLVVMERRRDIAVLSTLGATARSIMSVFIIEGAIVGGLGAAFGVALGALAILIANHYHLVSLPAEVYSISNIPLRLHGRDLALAALVAFVLSVLATIYPARAAARVRPAEMLRAAN